MLQTPFQGVTYTHMEWNYHFKQNMFLVCFFLFLNPTRCKYKQMWCENASPQSLLETIETDEHSPQSARVNGVMKNSKDFAEIWRCPVGSPMNPENKCKIFWNDLHRHINAKGKWGCVDFFNTILITVEIFIWSFHPDENKIFSRHFSFSFLLKYIAPEKYK